MSTTQRYEETHFRSEEFEEDSGDDGMAALVDRLRDEFNGELFTL